MVTLASDLGFDLDVDFDVDLDLGREVEIDLEVESDLEVEFGSAQRGQKRGWLYEGEEVTCELVAHRDSP